MLQVQKWGDSLSIRIPEAIALKVGLEVGSKIAEVVSKIELLISC